MYIFIEYSDNYLKTSGILWQFCRYVPVVDNDGAVTDFKQAAIVLKNVEIMVPLKYLIDFWRTLEMSLINCVIILGLNWSENCVIVATNVAAQATTISITDTKLYVPDVILSTQNNEELLEQLKSSFKWTINWNKYQTKASTERQNQYLDSLIDPSLQGV